jgi:hypothetical protein
MDSGQACVSRGWSEKIIQERLRKFSAYAYGTEGDVENEIPNPWGWERIFLRALLFISLLVAGPSGGLWSAGWLSPLQGFLGLIVGGVADAYWDNNLTIRRMDDNNRIDNPRYQRSWNWGGAIYWAVREGQGQIG